MQTDSYTGTEIAVIGISGRFPRAGNLDEFWRRLVNGEECITTFTEDELIAAGIDAAVVQDPQYIKRYGWLEHSEDFDPDFFQYNQREALLMDPQMRVLHEVTWEALEDAGYNPEAYTRRIGLYVGASDNLYWQVVSTLSGNKAISEQFEAFQLNNKDFLATQIAYKLHLRGPAVTIATACSTSLTTIHMACQALLGGECEMALAGGITIALPAKKGYLYQDGMILSPDGHCRAFDANGMGIVGGNGAGMVVLKLLDQALNDHDQIYAVIKGSAINNDGRRKVGYSAPSVEGQVDVIRLAQRAAEVPAETITYIEAHGTATPLGDSVEIEALKQAFSSAQRQYCAIGSVKSNLGHLDSAAGVAGFIKVLLMLQHKLLPPAVNFETPNPHIDFQHSPFYINTTLKAWETAQHPRRAGVSSFGIGGTNAHIVLEEAPARAETRSDDYQVIPLSAQSAEQVQQLAARLADFTAARPEVGLHDIAYTLQTGRKHMRYRQALVCRDSASLHAQLTQIQQSAPIVASADQRKLPGVVFMFPGQGAQYAGMGRELLGTGRAFDRYLHECLTILARLTSIDYHAAFYGTGGDDSAAINSTVLVQPFLFAFEYALARVLIDCGVRPDAMIGYSLGELVAACIANVCSLEDALFLVTRRGELMQTMPEGSMLSVLAPEAEIAPFLDGRYSIAAVNSAGHTVVSGPSDAIAQLGDQLQRQAYVCRRLHTSHAFHSPMMEPMLAEFRALFERVTLRPPTIPFVSNLTGTWITDEQATSADYWCRQLRHTLRFHDGLTTLLAESERVFIEVGPGNTLSSFLASHEQRRETHRSVNLVRHIKEAEHDLAHLLRKLAQLWTIGLPVSWQPLSSDSPGRRVSLPTYPFKRTTFTLQADPLALLRTMGTQIGTADTPVRDWFYMPVWKRAPRQGLRAEPPIQPPKGCLVFVDRDNSGQGLAAQLDPRQYNVITVTQGERFQALAADTFCINPACYDDYVALIQAIAGLNLTRIVHLWSLTADEPTFAEAQAYGLYSVLQLVKALSAQSWPTPLEMTVVANGMHAVQDGDQLMPGKATLLGLLRVIPQEVHFIGCRLIDIRAAERSSPRIWQQIAQEIGGSSTEPVVAYRGQYRWMLDYERVPLPDMAGERPAIKRDGVYLITGGLGKLGLLLAEHITIAHGASVALVGRSPLPAPDQWQQWLDQHSADDQTSRVLRRLRQIEEQGGRVGVYHADVADVAALTTVVAAIEAAWGPIDGVIHAAAATHAPSIRCPITATDATTYEEQFAAKVYGTLALDQVLGQKPLDFAILFSSLAATLGGLGFAAYAAANSFMDHFVISRNQAAPTRWVSAQWDHWAVDEEQAADAPWTAAEQAAITPAQGTQAFDLLLTWPEEQALIASADLKTRLERWRDPVQAIRTASTADAPDMAVQRSGEHAEAQLIAIWEEQLGQRPISPHDNFFELGGDSLKALSILARIQRVFGRKLELSALFTHPTIAGLLPLLAERADTTWPTIPPADQQTFYPLYSAQTRLFILNQLHRSSTSYNIPQVLTIQGDLDRDRLEQCLRALADRHEALRASFHMIKGQPLQRIHDQIEVKLNYLEADAATLEPLIHSLIRPFALDTPPLFKATLIKYAEQQFVLVFDIHHIITDGASFRIFFQELGALYNRRELPPIALRYRDYCVYQQSRDHIERLAEQRRFWSEQFAGDVPLLELPTDFARKEQPSYAGTRIAFSLDQTTSQAIRARVVQHRTTGFVFFLAIMNIWLAKLSGQDDIVIGTPIQGRAHPDTVSIFGHFVDVLPLRNAPMRDLPFDTFLNAVTERTVQAFENQDVWYTEIVEMLQLKWQANRNPLFDAMIVMQNQQHPTLELPGMTIKPYDYRHQASKFDLALEIAEQGEQFRCALEYSSDLFRAQTIEQYISYFTAIIDQVLADGTCRIADIRLASSQAGLALAQSSLEFDWNE